MEIVLLNYDFCTDFTSEALVSLLAVAGVASNPVFALSAVSAWVRLAGVAICGKSRLTSKTPVS